jgi:hypothetical protein
MREEARMRTMRTKRMRLVNRNLGVAFARFAEAKVASFAQLGFGGLK